MDTHTRTMLKANNLSTKFDYMERKNPNMFWVHEIPFQTIKDAEKFCKETGMDINKDIQCRSDMESVNLSRDMIYSHRAKNQMLVIAITDKIKKLNDEREYIYLQLESLNKELEEHKSDGREFMWRKMDIEKNKNDFYVVLREIGARLSECMSICNMIKGSC